MNYFPRSYKAFLFWPKEHKPTASAIRLVSGFIFANMTDSSLSLPLLHYHSFVSLAKEHRGCKQEIGNRTTGYEISTK